MADEIRIVLNNETPTESLPGPATGKILELLDAMFGQGKETPDLEAVARLSQDPEIKDKLKERVVYHDRIISPQEAQAGADFHMREAFAGIKPSKNFLVQLQMGDAASPEEQAAGTHKINLLLGIAHDRLPSDTPEHRAVITDEAKTYLEKIPENMNAAKQLVVSNLPGDWQALAPALSSQLGKMHDLQALGFADNGLDNASVAALAPAIAKQDKLTWLYLNYEKIDSGAADSLVTMLDNKPNLQQFDLGGNKIDGAMDKLVPALAKLPELKYLDFQHTDLKDHSLTVLADAAKADPQHAFAHLSQINLTEMNFTGEGLRSLTAAINADALPQLKLLQISKENASPSLIVAAAELRDAAKAKGREIDFGTLDLSEEAVKTAKAALGSPAAETPGPVPLKWPGDTPEQFLEQWAAGKVTMKPEINAVIIPAEGLSEAGWASLANINQVTSVQLEGTPTAETNAHVQALKLNVLAAAAVPAAASAETPKLSQEAVKKLITEAREKTDKPNRSSKDVAALSAQLAIMLKDPEIKKYITLADDNGDTLLHAAARLGDTEAAKELLKDGASLLTVNKQNQEPFKLVTLTLVEPTPVTDAAGKVQMQEDPTNKARAEKVDLLRFVLAGEFEKQRQETLRVSTLNPNEKAEFEKIGTLLTSGDFPGALAIVTNDPNLRSHLASDTVEIQFQNGKAPMSPVAFLAQMAARDPKDENLQNVLKAFVQDMPPEHLNANSPDKRLGALEIALLTAGVEAGKPLKEALQSPAVRTLRDAGAQILDSTLEVIKTDTENPTSQYLLAAQAMFAKQNALIAAVKSGDAKAAHALIKAAPTTDPKADISDADLTITERGKNLLHLAALSGKKDLLPQLAHKLGVDSKSEEGLTALDYAVTHNHVENAKALLTLNASMHNYSDLTLTPQMQAVVLTPVHQLMNAINNTVDADGKPVAANLEAVNTLLTKHPELLKELGTSLNYDGASFTPTGYAAYRAAESGNADILAILTKDINAEELGKNRDKEGYSPLMTALNAEFNSAVADADAKRPHTVNPALALLECKGMRLSDSDAETMKKDSVEQYAKFITAYKTAHPTLAAQTETVVKDATQLATDTKALAATAALEARHQLEETARLAKEKAAQLEKEAQQKIDAAKKKGGKAVEEVKNGKGNAGVLGLIAAAVAFVVGMITQVGAVGGLLIAGLVGGGVYMGVNAYNAAKEKENAGAKAPAGGASPDQKKQSPGQAIAKTDLNSLASLAQLTEAEKAKITPEAIYAANTNKTGGESLVLNATEAHALLESVMGPDKKVERLAAADQSFKSSFDHGVALAPEMAAPGGKAK